MVSFLAHGEEHFKKVFPSDFVKLGYEILYLFLAEKWPFVVLFVAMLCPILADFKKIVALRGLSKMPSCT